MTVQRFLDFLISYLNRLAPVFGSPVFSVPVWILITVGAVTFIKYIINGGLNDV